MTSTLSDVSKTIPYIAVATAAVCLTINYFTAKIVNKYLSIEPGEALVNRVNAYATRHGIDQKFSIRRIRDELSTKRIFIDMCIQPEIGTPILAISSNANDFTIAHELAHLKKKHCLKISPIYIGIWTTAITVFLATRNVFGFYTVGSLAAAYVVKEVLTASLVIPLMRKHEEEADALATEVVSSDNLAVAVQMFNSVNSERELAKRHLAHKGSLFHRLWKQWDIATDPHPDHMVRCNRIFTLYRHTTPNYPIKIGTETETLLECSEDEAKFLKEMVYASSRRYILLNFDRMVVKPDSPDGNVSLHIRKADNEYMAKWDYEVSAEKIHRLIQKREFALVHSILSDILDSPSIMKFIGDCPIEHKDAVLEKLKATYPFYDWDHAKITADGENKTTFSVKEK